MGHTQGARGRIWSIPVTLAMCTISPAAAGSYQHPLCAKQLFNIGVKQFKSSFQTRLT